MRTVLVGVALLLAGLAPLAHAQTLAEVQLAVDSCVGPDEQAKAARADLARWGNEALPFLREIAGKAEDATLIDRLLPAQHDVRFVCAVQSVDTPEAVDFLVEILDRKTRVEPHPALTLIRSSIGHHREHMESHVRLKQLVFKFAKDGDGRMSRLARRQAAELMAALDWDDGVPLLELMLTDDDQDVRSAAAEAIESLTGRAVTISKPELSFPAVDITDLLAVVQSIDRHQLRGSLVPWFDGQPALVTGSRSMLRAMQLDGTVRDRAVVGVDVLDIGWLPLPDRSQRWVISGKDASAGIPSIAVCIDREQRELWRFTPAEIGIESMCRLYDETGCIGVALAMGGEQGVVGLDPDGQRLFRVPRTYVTYGAASHPRLPGLWLHYGGNLDLYDNRGEAIASNDGWPPIGPFLFASHAVLVPAADGTPAIVAAGQAENSEHVIARLDAELQEAWRATVPDRLTALVLLDPGDRAPLLAATTASGELLVFDLDGVLRQRSLLGPFAGPVGSMGVAVYSISVGRLPDGRYGMAIGFLPCTLVYAPA